MIAGPPLREDVLVKGTVNVLVQGFVENVKFAIGLGTKLKAEYNTGEAQLVPSIPKVTEKVPALVVVIHRFVFPVTPGPVQE